ncbi:MAG: (d)CMP kinase [Betaproteobacteria bacterium]|nr:(d)CMP kinase [Betaproteobacteria bacterium]
MGDNRHAPVIAIDGPSASGKGTVARLVADKLGFHFLDSGALYRLVALAALQSKTNLDDTLSIEHITMKINGKFCSGEVWLEGARVTEAIRNEEVSAAASRVAALPGVRQALLQRQRAFRRPPGLVADGRDMGSTVFPDAELKIFLTASPEERARRRYKQLMEKGMRASMITLLQEMRERDARDSARAVAPLQKCEDAIELDTTGLPVEAVVSKLLVLYAKAQKAP